MEIRITKNFHRIKKSADFKTEWSQRKKLKKVNNKQVLGSFHFKFFEKKFKLKVKGLKILRVKKKYLN